MTVSRFKDGMEWEVAFLIMEGEVSPIAEPMKSKSPHL